MQAKRRISPLAAGGGLAVIVLLLWALLTQVINPPATNAGATPTTTGPSAAASCTSWQVHYFHNDAGKMNAYDFGPPLQGSTPRAKLDDLQHRYTCDPALVVADAHAKNIDGLGNANGVTALKANTLALAANVTQWKKVVSDLDSYENSANLSETTQSGPYYTEQMVSEPDGVPLIEQANPNRSAPVLVMTWPNSNVVWVNEEDCGGQFRAQLGQSINGLQQVPAIPSTPGTTPPVTTPYHPPVTTPYHPPVTTPYHPPVTTPYHPPVTTKTCYSVYGPGYLGNYPNCYKPQQSFNCQQNGVGCPAQNHAVQPPQTGGNATQTSNGKGSTTAGAPPQPATNTAPAPVNNVGTSQTAPASSSQGSNAGPQSTDGHTGVPAGSTGQQGSGTAQTGTDAGTSNGSCASAACGTSGSATNSSSPPPPN